MKTIILGPPGTGKTTTLLNLVDDFMKAGVDSKRIGYFSFTKKAANEAATRAAEKFNLDEQQDLINFRTLHSLAFRILGVSKERVMKKEDYREYGLKVGIPIRFSFILVFHLKKGTFLFKIASYTYITNTKQQSIHRKH